MFEVGKKYKYCEDSTIAKCIFAGKTVWVLVDTKTGQEYTPMTPERWKEYKEPRTITRWINVYEDVKNGYLSLGNMWEDKGRAIRHGREVDETYMTYKDTIPITYTEPL